MEVTLISKQERQKELKTQYWRTQHSSKVKIEENREIFSKGVIVFSVEKADKAKSFCAIMDSRKEIVVK